MGYYEHHRPDGILFWTCDVFIWDRAENVYLNFDYQPLPYVYTSTDPYLNRGNTDPIIPHWKQHILKIINDDTGLYDRKLVEYIDTAEFIENGLPGWPTN